LNLEDHIPIRWLTSGNPAQLTRAPG